VRILFYPKFILIFSLLSIYVGTVSAEPDDVKNSTFIGSLSLGYGKIESPLNFVDDVQFSVLPSWSYYYKDVFYIENTTAGFNLAEHDDYLIDAVVTLNKDGLYYVDDNILFNSRFIETPFNPFGDFANPNANAKVSVMSGIDVTRVKADSRYKLGMYKDVSKAHNGAELIAEAQQVLYDNGLRVAMLLGANYKSTRLLEYYYGYPLYGANTNYYAQIDSVYPLTEKLGISFYYRYEHLSGKINSSEVTDKKNIHSVFLGITWSFSVSY
jgi:MipA family protein